MSVYSQSNCKIFTYLTCNQSRSVTPKSEVLGSWLEKFLIGKPRKALSVVWLVEALLYKLARANRPWGCEVVKSGLRKPQSIEVYQSIIFFLNLVLFLKRFVAV